MLLNVSPLDATNPSNFGAIVSLPIRYYVFGAKKMPTSNPTKYNTCQWIASHSCRSFQSPLLQDTVITVRICPSDATVSAIFALYGKWAAVARVACRRSRSSFWLLTGPDQNFFFKEVCRNLVIPLKQWVTCHS